MKYREACDCEACNASHDVTRIRRTIQAHLHILTHPWRANMFADLAMPNTLAICFGLASAVAVAICLLVAGRSWFGACYCLECSLSRLNATRRLSLSLQRSAVVTVRYYSSKSAARDYVLQWRHLVHIGMIACCSIFAAQDTSVYAHMLIESSGCVCWFAT